MAARVLAAEQVGAADATTERVLDAALEQFQLVGLRRSSVEDVARRAGVSRVTIYRRFPQKDLLVEGVVLRECGRVLAEVEAAIESLEGAAERIARGWAVGLRIIREHLLLNQLLAIEPENVLPFLTIDSAPLVELGTLFISDQIRRGQREGDIPEEVEPEPLAEILVRIAHSLILTPGARIPVGDEEAAAGFAREFIVPLVTGRHA